MHKTQYRPTRSQQLMLAEMVKKEYLLPGTVIVHHVLEDSFTRLYLQIEYRFANKVSFYRWKL